MVNAIHLFNSAMGIMNQKKNELFFVSAGWYVKYIEWFNTQTVSNPQSTACFKSRCSFQSTISAL